MENRCPPLKLTVSAPLRFNLPVVGAIRIEHSRGRDAAAIPQSLTAPNE